MHGTLDDKRRAPAYAARVERDAAAGDESRALSSALEWTKLSRREFFDVIGDPIFSMKKTRVRSLRCPRRPPPSRTAAAEQG